MTEFQEVSYNAPLEGDIADTLQAAEEDDDDELSTLDEPVKDTFVVILVQRQQIKNFICFFLRKWSNCDAFNSHDDCAVVPLEKFRDFKAVGQKFSHIVFPRRNKVLLRDWDLWGPLILCVVMAILLQGVKDEKTGSGGPEFAQVFIVVWAGAAIVTLNSQLLGGHISFFQSVCVLGYCMCPLVVAMIICWTIVHLAKQTILTVILRIVATALAYGWSIFASVAFLGDSQPSGRKPLAVYPICLFYFILAWMVVTYTV